MNELSGVLNMTGEIATKTFTDVGGALITFLTSNGWLPMLGVSCFLIVLAVSTVTRFIKN